jgi:DNA-directed RNA polymerase subunit RPC12/RpoP
VRMKLEVLCPACKKQFRFTDRSDLETVACPHCGDEVSKDLGTTVVDQAVQPTKNKSRPMTREESQVCPHCGKSIPIKARKCKFCRAWIDNDDDEEEAVTEYAPCPRCGARRSEKVIFTFWGSFYGPALLTHVQCPKCYYKYNGKTGKSNLIPAILFVLVPVFLILAVIGGVILMTINLARGP